MRIVFREASKQLWGSPGAAWIRGVVERAGHRLVEREGDVELVSVHHSRDLRHLVTMERRAPVRLLGGHPLATNPHPYLLFADALCVGEGESWVLEALAALEEGAAVPDLARIPGTIVPATWDGVLPPVRCEPRVPDHPPYLNRRRKGHAEAWYVEVARGCPHACHYCELGHTLRYRIRPTEDVLAALRSIDTSRSRRVVLLAPDIAAHPGYPRMLRELERLGLTTCFASMRLDEDPSRFPLRPGMLVRVGIDGLTEETRHRVGKPITDRMILDYFARMSARGHRSFKVFMIFGYPWETAKDVDRWERLWHHITRLPRMRGAHVRVKWTALIPQARTPMFALGARYDDAVVGRIATWHALHQDVGIVGRHAPAWHIRMDAITSRGGWEWECGVAAYGLCGSDSCWMDPGSTTIRRIRSTLTGS